MAIFTDVFEDVTKQGRKIPTSDYHETGVHPIIDQGQSAIAGYTDETDGLFTDVPAIIFGDHTRVLKYVDTPCFLGADGVKLLKTKIANPNYKYLYYVLSNTNIPNTGYNRHFKWLKEVNIPLPDADKQQEIVDTLDKISELIALRKAQLAKLDQLVKSRFIELFGDTKTNECQWNTLPLHKVLESGSSVSYGIVQTGDDIEGGVPVFRPIDIAGGKIPQREQLKRTANDISNQYSRTLLKGYELLITVRGSVGETFRVTSEFAGCNVGRNIVPLRFDTEIVDYSFMQHFFAQEGTKRVLESMTKGIALQGLNMSEFREIDVIIPAMSLQQQFAAFVEQTDKSKLAIQQSLDKLETLKKSLMQKYFG